MPRFRDYYKQFEAMDPEEVSAELPSLQHVLTYHDLEGLAAHGRDFAQAQPNALAEATEAIGEDDLFTIIYTSGTTGKAKGAILTHQNLTWVALNCIVDYDVASTDIALMISPLFHVASLGMGALPVILNTLPAALGVPISSSTVEHLNTMIIGALIIAFLIIEPHGLARFWELLREKLIMWPFPH